MTKNLIVLVGPTAVGKTAVSVSLAEKLGCSIINADSRQAFKELRIGTAKPTHEEMRDVKHYFVNDRSITDEISAGKFEDFALDVISDEFKHNDLCMMSGGSGLYIEAVCYGLNSFPEVKKEIRSQLMTALKEDGVDSLYSQLTTVDPEYAALIEPRNSQRIVRALEIYRSSGKTYSSLRTGMNSIRDFKLIFIGLERPREELYDRINRRMDQMIDQGLFEEAAALIDHKHTNALQTVGYNEVYLYLEGKVDKTEAIRLLKRNSRRYAKRQMTWFNRNPETEWFCPDEIDEMLNYIKKKLHT